MRPFEVLDKVVLRMKHIHDERLVHLAGVGKRVLQDDVKSAVGGFVAENLR